MITLKKATTANNRAIFNLLQTVMFDMQSKGIKQWNEHYPTKKHVDTDIEMQTVYIGIFRGQIAAVISLDENQSPEYKNINWKHTAGKAMVVHRMAVLPRFQKKGFGRKLMDFALEKAHQDGCSSIRLDAYSKNERTLNFYKKRGYELSGEIKFPYREAPFFCFEKNLK